MRIAIIIDRCSTTSYTKECVHYLSKSLTIKGYRLQIYSWGTSQDIAVSGNANTARKDSLYIYLDHKNLDDLYDVDLIHNFSVRFLENYEVENMTIPIITTITEYSSVNESSILRIKESILNHTLVYSSKEIALKYGDILDASNVITTGIDLVDWPFNDSPFQDYLLYHNDISADCGLEYAIKIAEKWHKKLLISGSIRSTEYYKTVIEPLLDTCKITYIGELDDQKLSHYLQNVIGLINTSDIADKTMLTIAKSLASGTPVISINTDRSATLTGASYGIDIKSEKVIERPPDISILLRISRASCRRRALTRFNNVDMIKSYTNLYRHVLRHTTINLKPAS